MLDVFKGQKDHCDWSRVRRRETGDEARETTGGQITGALQSGERTPDFKPLSMTGVGCSYPTKHYK